MSETGANGTSMNEPLKYDNTPVIGCRGCETTAGRMGCATHGACFNLAPFVMPRVDVVPCKTFVTCGGCGASYELGTLHICYRKDGSGF